MGITDCSSFPCKLGSKKSEKYFVTLGRFSYMQWPNLGDRRRLQEGQVKGDFAL